jgi:hypothetical protein
MQNSLTSTQFLCYIGERFLLVKRRKLMNIQEPPRNKEHLSSRPENGDEHPVVLQETGEATSLPSNGTHEGPRFSQEIDAATTRYPLQGQEGIKQNTAHSSRADLSSSISPQDREEDQSIGWPLFTENRRHDPITPMPETVLPEAPRLTKRPTRKLQLIMMLIMISALLVSSAVLFPSLLVEPVTTTLTIPRVPQQPQSVGNLIFFSSGQLDPNSDTGLNDIVSLNLVGLTSPGPGMSDYAWLEADTAQNEIAPILLGTLSVQKGKAQLTYRDKQHTDLLASYSRLLVTEQAGSLAPDIPSLDPKTWRYQASIPDIPTPGDENGYSLLSHLRHLLAKDPTLQQIGLQGGLDIWLYRNMGKILEWSNAARDNWASNDVDLTRRGVDRVVEYLDGQAYASEDLPPGTPWLVDPKAGKPGIIDLVAAQDEQPPSYISHIEIHLMGLIQAPGHTLTQQQLATHINDVLTQIESLLKKVRSDAVQLVNMSNDQLKQQEALTLLNDMQTNATNAYVGQANPTTGAVQAGEVYVHAQLQSLATIPIMTVPTDDL